MRKKRLVKAYKKTKAKKTGYEPMLLYSASIVFLLTLSAILLSKSFFSRSVVTQTVLAESRDILHEKSFWTNILNSSPTYLPGLLALAKIENELGDNKRANELIERAKFINPNEDNVKDASRQ